MAENNKTRFFYVLYSDKTRVFDQSERAYYPIYIINIYIRREKIYIYIMAIMTITRGLILTQSGLKITELRNRLISVWFPVHGSGIHGTTKK